MNRLDWKYRHDELTSEELKLYKEEVDFTSDETLEHEMFSVWQAETVDTDKVSYDRLKDIKKRIDTINNRPERALIRTLKVITASAAVIIPLLIMVMLHYQSKVSSIVSDKITISTSTGEKATIKLPDGTSVTLNENSNLAYKAMDFADKQRHVNLNGEAYFDVVKDKKRPFSIDGKYIKVRVTGTKFDLISRSDATNAEISMESGSVIVTSLLTNKTANLTKGQRGVIDYATGNITVTTDVDILNLSPWRTGNLNFFDADLHHVITVMDRLYAVKISVNNEKMYAYRFTGVLPANNMMLAVRIISKAYGMCYSVKGNRIELKVK